MLKKNYVHFGNNNLTENLKVELIGNADFDVGVTVNGNTLTANTVHLTSFTNGDGAGDLYVNVISLDGINNLHWGTAESFYTVKCVDAGTNNVEFTSDDVYAYGSTYKFEQFYNNGNPDYGVLKVTKVAGTTGGEGDYDEPFTTLWMNEIGGRNITFASDFVAASPGRRQVVKGSTGERKIIVNGNNYKFLGNGESNGVEIGENVLFTLNNVSEVSNWLDFAFRNGGTLNINGDTLLKGDILPFQGFVVGGLQDIYGTTNIDGNLTLDDPIKMENHLNFTAGSLNVDGTKIKETPAIRGLKSATVASGVKLYVKNAVKDQPYKILEGDNLDIDSWQKNRDMLGVSYGLILDTDNIVNDGNQFTVRFKEDQRITATCDIPDILCNLTSNTKAKAWVDNVTLAQGTVETINNTINTMANVAQLANVQQGSYAVGNLAMDSAFEHMSVFSKPVASYSSKVDFRNLSTDNKNYDIGTIPVGKVKNIQPVNNLKEDSKADMEYVINRRKIKAYKSHSSHSSLEDEDKTVWATYIHSKQDVKDMKVGKLEQNSIVKQDGVAVGADLWKSEKGFGGIVVTYAKGDVNSSQQVSKVKNDIDHYGASIYHRQDIGKFSIQIDAGYGKSENDIKMETLGAEEVTLKPKTEAYSAGIKIEAPLAISSKTILAPYVGVRYTYLKTDETNSSMDITYGENKQDMCSIPVGVSLRHQFPLSDRMRFGATVEGGYIFNVGDREGTQKLLYGDVTDTTTYNIVDKRQTFVRGAIQLIGEKMLLEVAYNHNKSDKVTDNRWNVNANFDF